MKMWLRNSSKAAQSVMVSQSYFSMYLLMYSLCGN